MSASNAIVTTFPSDLEIQMVRVFAAPKRLVYEAHTEARHVKEWWGRHGSTLIVCEIDARPGGTWRFVSREADGSENAFRGEIRELVPHDRIVWTFEWEGLPGHIVVDTLTLVEKDGKTTLTTLSRFSNKEDRDGMVASGMEAGANESMDRLDELLRRLV